jgi:hypothetical protein
MSALAAPASGSFFTFQSKTTAAGDDAIELGRRQLAQVVHFPARRRLLEEVQHFVSTSAVEEWFGAGAKPVNPLALDAATLFLMNLPASFLDAEISPEQDGGITIDWFRRADRQLSITFDYQGSMYYAAILGLIERVSGRVPFYGSVPEEIIRILQRLAV